MHDLNWVLALRSGFLTPVFKGFSALGSNGFVFFFLPIGYWLISKGTFSRMGLFFFLSALLNGYLKDLLQDPRPDPIFMIDPNVGESFGFPSGHAQLSVVMWFWIAWETRKSWMWILSILLVTGICFSRLYLGVHDVEDVLGGMTIGLASFLLFIFLTSEKFSWWYNFHPLWHIYAIAGIILLFFINWPAKLPGAYINFAFFVIGFWSGVILERNMIFFVKHDQIWRVILSGLVGLLLFFILPLGFREVGVWFKKSKTYIDLFQGFFLGAYITALAPWIFQQMKLAFRKKA